MELYLEALLLVSTNVYEREESIETGKMYYYNCLATTMIEMIMLRNAENVV